MWEKLNKIKESQHAANVRKAKNGSESSTKKYGYSNIFGT
jgi:hypothetical protein